ncbi:MAG: hypothetical protein ACXWEY_04455 [Bacteroidia bacterium]
MLLLWIIFLSKSIFGFCQYNDSCSKVWIKSFESFIRYHDSVSFYPKLYIKENQYCLNDTLLGINELAKGIFYGRKGNSFSYMPTYLHITTEPVYGYDLQYPKHISSTGISASSLPIEMLKIYYIQALFQNSFTFKKSVRLGYKNSNVNIEAFNEYSKKSNKLNAKILNDAEKSLEKWIKLLNEKGFLYLRSANIDPLHFSNLEWK